MSTEQETSITISKEDVEAEIACISGDAQKLSAYFQRPDKPLADVVQNITAALLANLPGRDLGPGNWKLRFFVRNGRPPRRPPEITSALLAITHGQWLELGIYLLPVPQLDDDTWRALADAFDPAGTSKWQLRFVRRRGNQRSGIRAAIGKAFAARRANNLQTSAKRLGTGHNLADDIYPKVRREIEKEKLELVIKAGNSTIRAGRAAIKRQKT
jgi:hypothetical protein